MKINSTMCGSFCVHNNYTQETVKQQEQIIGFILFGIPFVIIVIVVMLVVI